MDRRELNESIEIIVEREINNYKKFAFGQNFLGLSVAFVLAATIQKLVNSIANNLLMPIISYCVNATPFDDNWRNFVMIPITGMKLEVGVFLSNFIEFLITTIVLYIIYVRFQPPKEEKKYR